jgi:hypothetical protein
VVLNWKFFAGAAILSCGLLLKIGAPILPLAAGVAVAALVNWRSHRRS